MGPCEHGFEHGFDQIGLTQSKGHTYTNPRPGQYFTHAHSHITRAVTDMDSCFALTGAHQHGMVNERAKNPCIKDPLNKQPVCH